MILAAALMFVPLTEELEAYAPLLVSCQLVVARQGM